MKKREIEGDFELNIASIIDCFTVLIVYLLLSASFITLGAFDVTTPTNAPDNTEADKGSDNKVIVTIGVQKNNNIKVNIEGAETNSYSISEKNGIKDFDGLAELLQKIKEKHPTTDSAMIVSEDDILYKEIIKTIEVTRLILPQVALSSEASSQAPPQ